MKKTLITITTLFFCLLSYSQKSPKELKGDKYFEKLNYYKAIDKYVALDSTISTEGLRNLAESYRLTYQIEAAEEAYANLVTKEEAEARDYYYYAYVLKENKKYLESNKWMQKFQATVSSDDLRAQHFVEDKDKVSSLLEDQGQFEISNLKINTAEEDFGTAYYNDQIVFASSREGVKAIKRRWSGNQLSFLDLYVADVDSGSVELDNVEQLYKKTNKKYHEGPAAFAKEGTYMAFTRNSYTGTSTEGEIKFQIFFMEQDSLGKWSEPESFHANSEEYSVGHPWLSEDGKTMYFASDMPGGYGMADIYKVEKTSEGSWGEPVNLGKGVNTEANDMFPFYQENQELLLFASDGHVGLGGLDLFVSPLQNGAFKEAKNLGSPMNSNKDDFAVIYNADMTAGYFSSNREEGKGDDDIYSFTMLKPFIFGKRIEGIAKDTEDNILAGVEVDLYENGEVVQTATTDENGMFSFMVEADKDFSLEGEKEEYFPGQNTVSTATELETVYTDVVLEKSADLSLYTLVRDSKTSLPLDSVTIYILDNFTGEEFATTLTGATGDMLKGIAGKKVGDRLSYNISLSKAGYFPKTVTFNHEITEPGQIDVHSILDLTMDEVVQDLAHLVEINPIKFDLNKYNIRPDAAEELDKIVEVMNTYPGMVVELGSHTDCRGSASYNETLSDNRAKASAEYIKTKITDPDRISGKGYGETKILNGCTCERGDGVPDAVCTEDEHSENRRTEFRVISTGEDNLTVQNNSTDSFGE